jgi:alcohol dehydrogenase
MTNFISDSQPVVIDGINLFGKLSNLIENGKVLVLTSQSVFRHPKFNFMCEELSHLELCIEKHVKPNPTPEDIDNLFNKYQKFEPRIIVAFGGGSVIDCGKVLKARFANRNVSSTSRLIELDNLSQSEIMLVAIPTTAGTGSEVTQFATIWTGNGAGKDSLESLTIKPNVVLLDPDLIGSASRQQLQNSGLDAISHCVETLWNRFKTTDSEEYAVFGLRKLLDALPNVMTGTGTKSDFENLQNGALYAGRAISVNRTAIAHSISYPLTAYLGVPHGLACSFTIPAIYKNVYLKSSNAEHANAILEESVIYLESLNLAEVILGYGTAEKIKEVGSSVSTESRSGNFKVDPSNFKIIDVLDSALEKRLSK